MLSLKIYVLTKNITIMKTCVCTCIFLKLSRRRGDVVVGRVGRGKVIRQLPIGKEYRERTAELFHLLPKTREHF